MITIADHSRVAVLEGGRVLHVRKVDDVDFGVYYCLIYIHTVDRYLTVQHGINVNGPYWGDLFLKYRTNLITGRFFSLYFVVNLLRVFEIRSHQTDLCNLFF